jgi:uncharacterized protein YqjF (DUF2071 family)
VAPRLLDRIPVVANDFDYRILNEVAHRPWPMPSSPWVMTQTWHDLLFAHWPVDQEQIRRKVPGALELDVRDGTAWVGIVPFRMTNVAPRAIPTLPWVSAFPELNVRTYVRVADKPGVYFFSLDAGSAIAVGVARTLLNLPYYSASMDVSVEDDGVRYRSERSDTPDSSARFAATYRPVGEPFRAESGSLEHFLTERYCLYTVDDAGRPHRLDIHHRPWPLQQAAAMFERNTMAAANGISLPDTLPLLHFAQRQDMVAWLPTANTGPL